MNKLTKEGMKEGTNKQTNEQTKEGRYERRGNEEKREEVCESGKVRKREVEKDNQMEGKMEVG